MAYHSGWQFRTPLQHGVAGAELSGMLYDIKMQVDRTVAQLPSHQTYVEQYCRAPDMAA